MSLRSFLFAADVLRIEEGVSFTMQQNGKRVAPKEEVRKRNQDAMAAFTGMMGGVQKGKGRR